VTATVDPLGGGGGIKPVLVEPAMTDTDLWRDAPATLTPARVLGGVNGRLTGTPPVRR
jgi:hypothetical protein